MRRLHHSNLRVIESYEKRPRHSEELSTFAELIEAISEEVPPGRDDLVALIVNDMLAEGLVRLGGDEQKNAA